jgi:hypothetical protein
LRQGAESLVESRFDLLLEEVCALANGLSAFGRSGTDPLQNRFELPLAAEDLRVLLAERLLGVGEGKAPAKLFTECVERGEDRAGDVSGAGLRVGHAALPS